MTRLTKPLLNAIAAALDAALAGEGFNGGDFDGMNKDHFERAREWVSEEMSRRSRSFEAIRLPDQPDAMDWAVTEAGKGLKGVVCGFDGRPERYASEAEARQAAGPK